MNLNDLPTIIPLFYLHVIKAVLTRQCNQVHVAECIYALSTRMCVCVCVCLVEITTFEPYDGRLLNDRVPDH